MKLVCFFLIIYYFIPNSWGSDQELQFSKASFFEQNFKKSGQFPTPILSLKNALEDLINNQVKALPYDRKYNPQLIYNFIPFGRSLHAASTDLARPRILFGYTPSKFSMGNRIDHKDFVDRLYVSYSELQNSLEVISWNNYEGRFNYEVVKNYIQSEKKPQQFIKDSIFLTKSRTQRTLCLTCHQSGGPLYADKPWSESSASFGLNRNEKSPITTKIEEAIGSKKYLGLLIDPIDNDGNRNSAAGAFHLVIKNSNSALLNARRMAKQSCGSDLKCRIEYLSSVLRLARSNYYEDTDNNFILVLPYRDSLAKLINKNEWPSHQFAYASPTILDRNPFADPSLVDYAKLSPATPRALIGGIPLNNQDFDTYEYAASQMLQKGYEGFGFQFSDLQKIRSCVDSEFEEILNSNEFQKIVISWNLNDNDSTVRNFVPLYVQVINLLSRCEK